MQTFQNYLKKVETQSGKKLKPNTDCYLLLKHLFINKEVSDYAHKVLRKDGYPMNNIRNRIGDLKRDYGVPIEVIKQDGKKWVKYELKNTNKSKI